MYPTYQTPIASRQKVPFGGWLFMGLACMTLAAIINI
jgi:hypothetical protein